MGTAAPPNLYVRRPNSVQRILSDVSEPSATRRYKEVVAGLAGAAEALRERDRQRAAGLARELVDLDAAMVRAERRATLSRIGIELHWEAALDVLWEESWLTLRPRPEPDPQADPRDLDALDAAVEERSAAVAQAARRRTFGLPRRRA